MDAKSITALMLGAASIGLQSLLWDRPLEAAVAALTTAGSLTLALTDSPRRRRKPGRAVRPVHEQKTIIQRIMR